MASETICIFMNALNLGGAERVIVHLLRRLVARGEPVELVLVDRRGPLLADVPETVPIREIGSAPRPRVWAELLRLPAPTRQMLLRVALTGKLPKVVRSVPYISEYLRRVRPRALLTTLPDNNIAVLWAAHLSEAPTRIVVREASMMSTEAAHTPKVFERRLPQFAAQWYPRAAGIVSVSDGVADDMAATADLSRQGITTIHNPVDIERIHRKAAVAPEHAWLRPGEPPVVLAVGRLYPQKDYPTLIHAFARVRAGRPVRLVILGEGTERPALEALVASLALGDDVLLPGAVDNPYAWMARAAVMALSSCWEGFPNVLLEALACGCPVVSTDCRSGPAELLAGGEWGRLVPVGDAEALAQAILATLAAPPPRERQQQRAAQFTLDAVLDRYLALML